MMTSYFCGLSFNTVRASSFRTRTRALAKGLRFHLAKNCAARSTGSQFSAMVTCSTGCASSAPAVMPLPRPSTNTSLLSGRAAMGKCANRYCVDKSNCDEASTFPLMRSPMSSFASMLSPRSTDTVASAASS